MSAAPESIVLCEGIHDRAFWTGWLTRFGCKDQRTSPAGLPVKGGHHGFRSPAGHFIRIIPAGGDTIVLENTVPLLKERSSRPLRMFVVNIDSDASSTDDGKGRESRLQSILRRFSTVANTTPMKDGLCALDDGTVVGAILWEAPDPSDDELPDKQTLERLACAAEREVFPKRATAVAEWLRGRPDLAGDGAAAGHEKAFAWSQMAGWYCEHGCDDFYQRLWRDEPVALALEKRLEKTGALAVVRVLVG